MAKKTIRAKLARKAVRSHGPRLDGDGVLASLRALLAALPSDLQAEVVPKLRHTLALWPLPEPTKLQPGEPEREADLATEVMGQDDRVRRRTVEWTSARWRKLQRCFHDYVLRKLRAAAKKRFPSEKALDEAVGELVEKAISEIAKDPERFHERHCKNRSKAGRR